MGARDRVADVAYGGGWAAVRWMPEGAARTLFRTIADGATRRDGASVQQLRRNLARVRPEAGPVELDAMVKEGMRRYLRYWREAFRLPTLGADRIVSTFHVVEGADYLADLLTTGRGVIISAPHMGNWDHAGAWFAVEHGSFTTVVERLKPESVYERFLEYRTSLGMEVLPLTGADRPLPILMERLRQGKLIAVLGDRDLSRSGVPVTFFGAEVRMPAGPASMALNTGAALVPTTIWYEGDRTCCIFHPEVVPPSAGTRAERIAATLQDVAGVFENEIRQHPVDWHMLQALWTEDLDPARVAERDLGPGSAEGDASG